MKRVRVYPIRANEEDDAIIAAIKRETGMTVEADIWRMGIRDRADKLGIPWRAETPQKGSN